MIGMLEWLYTGSFECLLMDVSTALTTYNPTCPIYWKIFGKITTRSYLQLNRDSKALSSHFFKNKVSDYVDWWEGGLSITMADFTSTYSRTMVAVLWGTLSENVSQSNFIISRMAEWALYLTTLWIFCCRHDITSSIIVATHLRHRVAAVLKP